MNKARDNLSKISTNNLMWQKALLSLKAIDALQLFLEEYPESDLVPLATEKLKICHTKLAKKAFETAEFYRKQGWPESALVYYDEVLKNYIDTNFADEAYYGKAYCLYELEKFDASRTVLQQLLAKFPGTALKEEIKELAEGILEANDTHSDSNT
ncbi:MAG: outer membrane protein assembly factor BamD [bacterium]